jgi:hypothetical protein
LFYNIIVINSLQGLINYVSYIHTYVGFPGGAVGKESACQCRRSRFDSWVGEDPLEEEEMET